MTQKKPSILKMVQNFAKESVNFIKQGAPITSTEEYEERIAICVSCEHFTEKKACGLCGCHMPVKAGWKTSECADTPPRWGKLVLTEKEEELLAEAATAEKEAKINELTQRIKNGERSLETFEMHTAGWDEVEKIKERDRLLEERSPKEEDVKATIEYLHKKVEEKRLRDLQREKLIKQVKKDREERGKK